MKIGFDAKRLFCNFTGLGNHSRTTIDILGAEYPETQMYLYTPRLTLNPTTQPYTTRRNCHLRTPQGIVKGSLWRTMAVSREAQRDGIDLWHGLSNELPMGLKSRHIPSVVTIHDVAFHTFPDMYHRHDRMIYDLKWRYACRNADQIIAISQCTARDIVKYYGVDERKLNVVYQPVNSIYYQEPTTPNRKHPYMLYVGSVNSRKNLMGVVQAMASIPESVRIPLVVVGDGGAYKRQVMEYVESHRLTSMVEWRTAASHDELRSLYTDATLFVYPSFYEGFGLPVVEASLCKCPVLTSSISSLPEAAGPHAVLVDPYDNSDIARGMMKLLDSHELREQIGADSRRYAMQTFSPSVLATNLMNVYHKTINRTDNTF